MVWSVDGSSPRAARGPSQHSVPVRRRPIPSGRGGGRSRSRAGSGSKEGRGVDRVLARVGRGAEPIAVAVARPIYAFERGAASAGELVLADRPYGEGGGGLVRGAGAARAAALRVRAGGGERG